MITTGCEGCCFLKEDNQKKGCVIGQLCVTKDKQTFAPGYCRMCRSHKWAKRQGSMELQQLYNKVLDERTLKFDMLVFFDEANNSIVDLEYTLNSDWYSPYAQKIIIMDVTGFGDRQNIALQYIKSREHTVPTIVDSSALREQVSQRENTIRRISKKVTSPFFLAIPAGSRLINFNKLAQMVKSMPSRVIHWSFPSICGKTAIIPSCLHYGLFITEPYLALTKLPEEEPFTEKLKKEEKETDMGLSWLCDDVCLV